MSSLSVRIASNDVPVRTSVISPGGASLMNSVAAESFWAFDAIFLDSIQESFVFGADF